MLGRRQVSRWSRHFQFMYVVPMLVRKYLPLSRRYGVKVLNDWGNNFGPSRKRRSRPVNNVLEQKEHGPCVYTHLFTR